MLMVSFLSSSLFESNEAVSSSFSTIISSFLSCWPEMSRYRLVFSLSSRLLKFLIPSIAVEMVVMGVLNSWVMLLIKSFLIRSIFFCLLMVLTRYSKQKMMDKESNRDREISVKLLFKSKIVGSEKEIWSFWFLGKKEDSEMADNGNSEMLSFWNL